MKINWLVRIKNPQWWLSVILAVVVPVETYYGITGSDITSWGIFFSTLKAAALNPHVVFSVLVNVWNAVINPATSGISDSANALTYKKPKK